jgi:hypothetical protein
VPRARRYLLAGALAAGVLELALLALWQRNGYWDFSDGVYAETAREILHGAALYRGVAAAQPPPVYLAGALLLALHDGLAAIRAGMAACQFASGALVAYAVLRLSGERLLAIAAGLATALLPIALHEHAQLIPETLAAPLIMAGAILCARARSAPHGGVALALAAACKVAFFVPGLAVVALAADRRRAAAGLAAAGLLFAAASLAGYGGALWTETVRAQFDLGGAKLGYVAGVLAQAAWNEFPLVLGALALVLWHRGEVRDDALLRTLTAAAAGGLVLGATLFKHGSYISVLLVAEPPLLALAATGALALWRRRGAIARVAVTLLSLLLAAQSLSLLISPADALIARRPGAQSGLAPVALPGTVSREVAAARRCPSSEAYGGAPYIAFLAGRRMPAEQPDLFMLASSSADAAFARRAGADQPSCI